jgi:hypothetical protein
MNDKEVLEHFQKGLIKPLKIMIITRVPETFDITVEIAKRYEYAYQETHSSSHKHNEYKDLQKDWSRQKERKSNSPQRQQVNMIHNSSLDELKVMVLDMQKQITNITTPRSSSNTIDRTAYKRESPSRRLNIKLPGVCWNCGKPGHKFQQCTSQKNDSIRERWNTRQRRNSDDFGKNLSNSEIPEGNIRQSVKYESKTSPRQDNKKSIHFSNQNRNNGSEIAQKKSLN